MEKFENLKVIENKKYSPKEVLAYFIVCSRNVMNGNLDNYISSLKEELIKNANNRQILENVKLEFLEKIINYWSLSQKELLAYGYIVFNNLLYENKELTEKEITDMFIYTMRLYSPSNAEDFVNSNIINSSMIGRAE